MSRMKTFFKYALVVILFYIFSNVMINAFFKVSYTNITNYDINVNEYNDRSFSYICISKTDFGVVI